MKKLFIAMALLLSGFAGCNTAPEPLKIDNALTAEEIAAARLTPEVMWKMSRIGEHALSPDGETLLYTLTRYNMEENRGVTVIDAVGAYTNEDKKMLFCALKEHETIDFKKKIEEIERALNEVN